MVGLGRSTWGALPVALALVATNCGGSSKPPKTNSHGAGGATAGRSGGAGAAAKAGSGGALTAGRGGRAGTAGGKSRAGAGAGGHGMGGHGVGGRMAIQGGEGGAESGASGEGGRAGDAGADAGGAGVPGGDSGGLGGAGGASDTVPPDELGARLVLWFDAGHAASTVDGAKLAGWSDRSSAHNDAFQPAVDSQPTYVKTGVNGLPSVHFNGEKTFFEVADAGSLRFGTGAFALFAVVRGAPATLVNAMIYQKSEANDPWAGPSLLVNANKPVDSQRASIQLDGNNYLLSTNTVEDSTPRLLVGRRYPSAADMVLELRENGVSSATLTLSSSVNVDAPGRNAIIGHNGYLANSGFQAYEGDISELCAVKGALSDRELAGLERYLTAKYELH